MVNLGHISLIPYTAAEDAKTIVLIVLAIIDSKTFMVPIVLTSSVSIGCFILSGTLISAAK